MKAFSYFSLIIGLLVIAGCGGEKTQGSCGSNSISGTISGAEGETLVLQRFQNNQAVGADSVVVNSDGSFELNPSFSMPLDYYSLLLRDSNKFMILLTDSTENIEINVDVDNFQFGAEVKGSPHTAKLLEFYTTMEEYQANSEDLEEEMQQLLASELKGSPALNRLSGKLTGIKRERRNYALNFLRNESPSPAIMAALTELNVNVDLNLFEKAYADLQPTMGHSFYYEVLGKQINEVKSRQMAQKKQEQDKGSQKRYRNNKYMEGATPPDLSYADPNGKTRSLYDLRGKYVLIDFWASWCGPCRRENPNVVRLYNQYHNKGFEIFSVSLDKQKDRWVKAIEQDNLKWPDHVSDLKGWNSDAAQLYGISSIPHTILLDPDGKIIGTGLRGKELEDKLKEVLGSGA
jgi:thiol-disulfide isomerase/thioredoxin